ncbi:MAG: amidohydrolase [Chloroflexi bacterium]|nr:amidohydrolase [Chloroflexota bacterium]
MTADLILCNARAITLNPRQPLAQAVAIAGESIQAVGGSREIQALASAKTQVVDCRGLTLLPGFIDAHCHLLALAGSLTGVDCSPEAVKSVADLQLTLRQRADATPHGQWIRGYGYDDTSLLENRHPTRHDLDQAAPRHPVRLDHRSGHAVVLNSLGLELAGIRQDTLDPLDGVIDREPGSGDPTGLLFEMSGFLRERLRGWRSEESHRQGIAQLNQKLLACGITSVQDAGPHNGMARWCAFQELVSSGQLDCRLTMMVGADQLAEFAAAGMSFGSGDRRLMLGAAKIMLTMTTGAMQPDLAALTDLVRQAHTAGFPVAIHAIEQDAVAAAAQALIAAPAAVSDDSIGEKIPAASSNVKIPVDRQVDRIEHCSECPPQVLELVRRSGATVVTQPGFVYWNGDRYLEQVDASLLPHLYPIGSLHRAGVPVAFSSDSPVIDPNPWPGICASVTGMTKAGSVLNPNLAGPDRQIGALAALRMYTLAGAMAEGTHPLKGSIKPGKLADLILVDDDPLGVAAERLKDISAVLTVIGGRIAWDAGLCD